MKFLIAVFVFIATLGLTTRSIATETAHDAKCGAEDKAGTCNEATPAAHAGGHGNLSEKMNSLFPEKQKNENVGARPNKTELTSPIFLATVGAGTVKLKWKDTATATDYHVQIATDPNFKWLVANEKFVKTTSYEFAKAESGKRYFWRVASFKADNNSSYTKANFVSSAFNVK